MGGDSKLTIQMLLLLAVAENLCLRKFSMLYPCDASVLIFQERRRQIFEFSINKSD